MSKYWNHPLSFYTLRSKSIRGQNYSRKEESPCLEVFCAELLADLLIQGLEFGVVWDAAEGLGGGGRGWGGGCALMGSIVGARGVVRVSGVTLHRTVLHSKVRSPHDFRILFLSLRVIHCFTPRSSRGV